MAAPSLEDWFAIQNVFIRYATSLDHCDVDAVVACFTEDATIASPVLGTFRGHAGVRDFALRTVKAKQEGVQFRHVVTNLVVETGIGGDADRAHAQCYLLDFATREGRTKLLSPGEYDCTLRRSDGQWRFERRDVAMDQPFTASDF